MAAFFVFLALAIYTGITVNFLGKRFGDWRFSWSYIMGWVAMLMTFFAGKITVMLTVRKVITFTIRFTNTKLLTGITITFIVTVHSVLTCFMSQYLHLL